MTNTSDSNSPGAFTSEVTNLSGWDPPGAPTLELSSDGPWKHLTSCLDSVTSFGDFAGNWTYARAPNPVLKVGNYIIPLPLDDRYAESIRTFCREAPFGKGEHTLIDITVRQTWELSPNRFSILNPEWASFLANVLEDLRASLDIVGDIHAELHKLLLYDEGSFFKPHRDSQKVDGMIATLVICLPSTHKGGDVYLFHAGQPRVFSTSDESLFNTTALAWFTDVVHEVTKITSGHRLVLTYNVIHTFCKEQSAHAFDQQLNMVNQALSQCETSTQYSNQKLYVLDHKYSRAGLTFQQLKGRDRAVCQILREVSSGHGFYIFLAHLTRREIKDGYYGVGDDRQTTGVRQTLNIVTDLHGSELVKKPPFCGFQLLKDPYLSDRREDNIEGGEYIGNEMSTKIFKYYNSALIICPKKCFELFLDWRSHHIPSLPNMMRVVMDDLDANSTSQETRQIALDLLEKILTEYRGSRIFEKNIDVPALATWAWEREYRSLYGAAVKTTFVHTSKDYQSESMSKAIGSIVNADYLKSENNVVLSWDDYLDFTAVRSGRACDMHANFNQIEDILVDSLKSGFKDWRKATEVRLLDNYEYWEYNKTEEDFRYFIMSVIRSKLDDSDWFRNYFVPQFEARGDMALIHYVLGCLLTSTEPQTSKAKGVASQIINTMSSKIVCDLAIFSHFRGTKEYSRAAEGFSNVLEQCILSCLEDETFVLLDALWATIEFHHSSIAIKPPSYWTSIIPKAHRLLLSLLRVLSSYYVGYTDTTRSIFTCFLRQYHYTKPQKQPKRKLTLYEKRLIDLQDPYLLGLLGDEVSCELLTFENLKDSQLPTQTPSGVATAGDPKATKTAKPFLEVAGSSQHKGATKKKEEREHDSSEEEWKSFDQPRRDPAATKGPGYILPHLRRPAPTSTPAAEREQDD
ncbi:hypothetical protein F5Y18DRAFT_440368 [Xylariaceae sp. FL1019]|nr:hypothetical protein F5Y18DRAFT_440368 [Xylariaceae sp. FL1019]